MMQNKFQQSGFSLVETLVAITILLIVIAGPLAIISSASNSSMFASDQVTAFLLAQEGAELAQKARDDLVIRGFLPTGHASYLADPWATFANTSGTFASCYLTTGCGLIINSDTSGSVTVTNCSTSNINCQLQYAFNGNERSQFVHSSTLTNPSGFTRVITFQNTAADEVRVVSKVTWFSGTSRDAREVEVETFLFDVYGN